MKTLLLLLSASLFAIFPYQESPESPELKEASELSDSAIKLINQQKYDEALPLAKRALQIREKLLPATDPRVIASLHRLGDLYLVRRDYDTAKQTFERLLKILEERFGPTSWNLGATLDRLAMIYGLDRDFGKAEGMYQRAVAVREKAYGLENVLTARALFQLAQFYRYHKHFDRALSTYKQVMAIYGKVGVTAAEFEHISNGLVCLAYESENKALFKELEEMWKVTVPAMPALEQYDVLNGKAISMPKPDYPQAARDHRLSGTVIVLVDIDETGKVTRAGDMCQGPPYLSESSVGAALKARFTPTKISGTPVKVKGVLQYRFVNLGYR